MMLGRGDETVGAVAANDAQEGLGVSMVHGYVRVGLGCLGERADPMRKKNTRTGPGRRNKVQIAHSLFKPQAGNRRILTQKCEERNICALTRRREAHSAFNAVKQHAKVLAAL